MTIETKLPPRMRAVWTVLESAKDCGDAVVIAACRRLIDADRRGWSKHRDAADWALVQAVSNATARDEAYQEAIRTIPGLRWSSRPA